MISLQQQQQKPAELLWTYKREQRSPPAPTASSSLSCALESSMKVWQPTAGGPVHVVGADYSAGTGAGGKTKCFGNAMNMTWIDWTKPNCSMQGSDELSISSSSGGSRGASRTPSPFSLSSSGASSAGPNHPHLGNHIQSTNKYGSSATSAPTEHFIGTAADTYVGATTPDPAREGGQTEVYSRKVFVGGLPPDIDQDEIKEHFIRFGPLSVDWPHKAQSKAYFPPKGYAFLLFHDEMAVHRLIKMCVSEERKLFTFVSSVTQTHKKVQVRPWKLPDSDFIMDHTQPIDPRKTIFIGGVPRPLKAAELADIFNSRYGNVCYAGIDCDPEMKYPKGAGRVTFSSRVSFMSAVSCRFLQVTYGDIDKKVEVKPYVLDDQVCDECQGLHCGGRYAPYFCGNIHCLRYYCEHCWSTIHSAPGTQNHRCFVKENGDRPRAINFFPSQPRAALP